MSKRGGTSLAEIMGTSAGQHEGGLKLEHLPQILGEAMPELPKNPVGRHRLIRSLQQRFGPNFRSLPGVSGLIDQFDAGIDLERRIAQIRNVKYQPKGSK